MKGSGGSHYRKERFYLNSRYYFRWEMIKIIRLEILIVLYIAKINGNNLYFCCRTSHEVRGLKSLKCIATKADEGRTSHEVYGRSFGVSMNQFRDLHLKSHLTIAFLFTYNNKKGREW